MLAGLCFVWNAFRRPRPARTVMTPFVTRYLGVAAHQRVTLLPPPRLPLALLRPIARYSALKHAVDLSDIAVLCLRKGQLMLALRCDCARGLTAAGELCCLTLCSCFTDLCLHFLSFPAVTRQRVFDRHIQQSLLQCFATGGSLILAILAHGVEIHP